MSRTADIPDSWPAELGAAELVWHRANTETDIESFLGSRVRWIECDVRADPRGSLRVSHEPIEAPSQGSAQAPMYLSDWLGKIAEASRSVKVDLKEGGRVIDDALATISTAGIPDTRLWFNGAVEIFGGERGLHHIVEAHPGARISCPIDTLAPYLLLTDSEASAIVERMRSWGVSWLSLGSCVPGVGSLAARCRRRAWPLNIWDVEDRTDLERALSLRPAAITADLGSIGRSSND